MRTDKLQACYQHLGLPDNANLKDLDDAYFQLRGQMICAGNREAIPALKTARDQVKRHLLTTRGEQQLSPTTSATSSATEARTLLVEKGRTESPAESQTESQTGSRPESLTEALAHQGIVGRASLRGQILHLGIAIEPDTSQQTIAAEVYNLLSACNPADYGLSRVDIVRLYGLENNHKTLWKQSFPMPKIQATADDQDLYSFNNRFSNTLFFPGFMLIAALLNSMPVIQFLLGGVTI